MVDAKLHALGAHVIVGLHGEEIDHHSFSVAALALHFDYQHTVPCTELQMYVNFGSDSVPESFIVRNLGEHIRRLEHGSEKKSVFSMRPGLTLGAYSDPLGVGFVNGTVDARDIELSPAQDVIGGLHGVGHGWKFLMEALAAGRGIALPAGAAGSSKMLVCGVAGYAAIRKQFKLPLSAFEGVQEKLVDMALRTYEIDSMVAIMNAALDDGERPPVLSAILKQRTTELGRDVVMHAMDIVAGAAICMGPRNFVAPAYLSSPIGITVEGSNTMTRSLLIFGQGIVRSHPHLLDILTAIENDRRDDFARLLGQMLIDNAKLFATPRMAETPLEEFVHFFSLSSNASLVLGGELKRREFLSGRYADILSCLVSGLHSSRRKFDEPQNMCLMLSGMAAIRILRILWHVRLHRQFG